MTHQSLRRKFARFWQARGHREVSPISLVPEEDPTTLFTSSGMQPLIPFFQGETHPLGKRLYNIQRCFRSQDIEEVGDNRHTTFFEMLGNWSLGDYFKEEQLAWFWDFLTKNLALEKKRLFVSVFAGDTSVPRDEESAQIWQKLGLPKEQIFYYGVEKNWWSRAGAPAEMPAGEIGGPDSEVFYDLKTPHQRQYGKECHPNCDCGRFLEIGNSVFIQYKKALDGSLKPLPQKNVDFGGGLERLLVPLQNKKSVFQTDIFTPLIYIIEVLSGKKYGRGGVEDRSFRILADHLRAATFLIADGVTPGKVEQGYVLRRLIRRGIRFGRNLGLKPGFTAQVAQKVIETFADIYPHLSEKQGIIFTELKNEEKKFQKALKEGLRQFQKIIAKKAKVISARELFYLYETFGFPPEMTQELAREKGLTVDLSGFEKEKQRHQKISQKGVRKKFKGGLADQSKETIKLHTATHLLHQALREVLGRDVHQKGSNITAQRLRFDFTHQGKLKDWEIAKLEEEVNQKIKENLPVNYKLLPYQEAKKRGALEISGKEYPQKVKVYFIGDYSLEICGGPHVKRTGILGKFKIIKETSAGRGVRRIYAILEEYAANF